MTSATIVNRFIFSGSYFVVSDQILEIPSISLIKPADDITFIFISIVADLLKEDYTTPTIFIAFANR
jgi:hypothetical protein